MHWSILSRPDHEGTVIAVLGELPSAELSARILRAGIEEVAYPQVVEIVDCAVNEFPQCIARLQELGYLGVSVCVPFKAGAAQIAREFFMVRHAMGIANALKFSKGVYAQNTEVGAFSTKISGLKPGTALVMGSGPAARSAVISLFERGWRIRVWNRNVLRSRPFATVFETYGSIDLAPNADPAGCSLIVNATPIGARAGEQPPVKWESAGTKVTAIDFVFRAVPTEFLRSAAVRGFKTIDGKELLVEQLAMALEWWLARPVPRALMMREAGLRARSVAADEILEEE